ncbi:MAG: HutD family protein [Pseudomonadota bacterium]
MSVSPERFDLQAIAPQPWKNGAGLTREIAFGGASAAQFDWRISLAEVARDAPFSAFPGVDRCIVLLRGAGMRLRSARGAIEPAIDHALTTPLAPFRFPGDVALDATLVDGACSDFNVMTRRGVFRSAVTCERSATALRGGDVTLLLCSVGEWQVGGDESSTLAPMQALLWRASVESLRVAPSSDASALLVVRLCHDRQP